MDLNFTPAASLVDADIAATAFFARTPWAAATTVAVQLTPSTVAQYRITRTGSVTRVA